MTTQTARQAEVQDRDEAERVDQRLPADGNGEGDERSRRVVVVLDRRSFEALEWLTSEGLTRTSVISRALLVFKRLLAAQMDGTHIYLENDESKTQLEFY
jgi:hypothetical protein